MAQNNKFALVPEAKANSIPYLYVYVNDDGSVRELHQSERTYLETPFLPADVAQPYTKNSYAKKDGWGSLRGFCLRTKIPSNIDILPPPQEDPIKPYNEKTFLEEQTQLAKEKGFEVVQNADGSLTLKRQK